MATNGSFNTPQWHDYFSLKFEWSLKSQSIEENTSVITWSLKGETPSWITGMVTCGYFTITVDGVVVYSTDRYDRVNVYNGTVVATGEATVSHSADGTETFGVDIKAAVYDGEVNTTAYAEFSLPQIARASKPTLSASSANFGSAITVNTNRVSDKFTHALYYSINGGAEAKIADDIDASYKWTVPYSLMSNIPNAKSATITLNLYTYNGSTSVGNSTVSFTANVPDNSATKPSVSLNSLLPVSGLSSRFSSLYVQGKSKVQANVSSSGKYGATIKSCVMTVDGVSYGEKQSYTSDYLTSYGEKTVTITATDSRGLSNSVSQKINVVAYSVPKINVSTCRRCDANGNLSDSGTYLKIVAQRTYSKVMSGDTQNNFCLIRYRYKAAASPSYSAWTTILAGDSLSSDMVSTGALLDGALSVSTSYQVQIQALDDIGEYGETTINIETETVHTHKAPTGYGFGKYCEVGEGFDMGWDIELNDNEIYKNGEIAYAPYGFGYGGKAVLLKNDSLVADEADLEVELAKIYDAMVAGETKMISFVGYPSNSDWRWFGVLSKSSANNGSLVAHSAYGRGAEIVKTKHGGAWQPCEWENPPLSVAVEYRTTERYGGNKVVYTKFMTYTNAEAFSGVQSINVPHGISNLDLLISADVMTYGYLLPYVSSGTSLAVSAWSGTNITLYNGSSSWGANRTWYIVLRYTKK